MASCRRRHSELVLNREEQRIGILGAAPSQRRRKEPVTPNTTPMVTSRSTASRASSYYEDAVDFDKRLHNCGMFDSLEPLPFSDRSDCGSSFVIPPLDLRSECGYSTPSSDYSQTSTGTFTAKMVKRSEDAYQEWLIGKKKKEAAEAARKRKREEQEKLKAEERKRLAELKFEEWIEKKKRSEPSGGRVTRTASTTGVRAAKSPPNAVPPKRTPQRPQCSSAEAMAKLEESERKKKLEEWERKKKLEEEMRRKARREAEERRREEGEFRRIVSEEAFKRWLVEAAKKPKPVPLNRGIFTLRGTVSDIFVNPNKWKSNIDGVEEEEEDECCPK